MGLAGTTNRPRGPSGNATGRGLVLPAERAEREQSLSAGASAVGRTLEVAQVTGETRLRLSGASALPSHAPVVDALFSV